MLVAGGDWGPWVGVDAGLCWLPGPRLELTILSHACLGDNGAGVLPGLLSLSGRLLPGLPLTSRTSTRPPCTVCSQTPKVPPAEELEAGPPAGELA